ncbi:MAG TPA: CoA-binding protein [Dehalococcoidia bacterium]|nr:CoA-binding protein [Dehalococcoidia bacterium]
MDHNPSPEAQVLGKYRIIAVVGLSARADRPSHRVAAYLKGHGYWVIPVNPRESQILGEKAYPDLCSIPESVEVVTIFRRPARVPRIVAEAMYIGAQAVWMQLGIVHEAAAERARRAGMTVVMDRCMMVEHRKLSGQGLPEKRAANGCPGQLGRLRIP